MSVWEVILNTCNPIDIPPKPNRKEQRMVVIETFFVIILHTCFTPLVSSNIPVIKGLPKQESIPNQENTGARMIWIPSNKWVLLQIEIMTENKTMNPPIITTVWILSVMVLDKIVPKLEKVAGICLLVEEQEEDWG